jgi:uncharacterized protein YndB with AHSA1/START domain
MTTKVYKQIIKTSKETLWQQLFEANSYTVWATAFSHGSYTKGTMQQGQQMQYLDTAGNGLASVIKDCVVNESLIIEHHYEVKNFEIDSTKQDWYGMQEIYRLNKINDEETELELSIVSIESFLAYFDATLPNAISTIQWLCEKNIISIAAEINAPLDKVWNCYTEPQHLMKWNFATPEWHCPKANADLQVGGKFSQTMAAKDGSFSFDFEGVYTEVVANTKLAYTMSDGRDASILFIDMGQYIRVIISFEPEQQNPRELQMAGWQAILNSFKKYAEQ